jgi:hypothetical protein
VKLRGRHEGAQAGEEPVRRHVGVGCPAAPGGLKEDAHAAIGERHDAIVREGRAEQTPREAPVTARERQFQAPPGLLCQVCQTASSVPMPKTSRRPSLFCADERLPFRLPDSVFQPLQAPLGMICHV